MTEFEPPVIGTFDNGETQKLRGARHLRENNRSLLIPDRDRVLTITCTRSSTMARKPQRRVFAVVAKGNDETLLLSGLQITRQQYDVYISNLGEPYVWSHSLGHLCPCGERHAISIGRVWEVADAVRHQNVKARNVPWQRVALD